MAGRVLRQFRVVFGAVRAQFSQVGRMAGVGGSQLWALSTIAQRPGLGVGALALALNVRQPSASRLVRSLVQQGLVEARRGGTDRRAVQLHATAGGRSLLRRSHDPLAGELASALAHLDPGTLERLEQHLDLLLARLGAQDGQAAGPRPQT